MDSNHWPSSDREKCMLLPLLAGKSWGEGGNEEAGEGGEAQMSGRSRPRIGGRDFVR